jgi:hypothetical protein
MSWKRLAVYLGCAALIYCVVMGAAIIKRTRQNDQLRNNLRLVEAHLALAGPQWKAFRQTNAGLEFAQLHAYLGVVPIAASPLSARLRERFGRDQNG